MTPSSPRFQFSLRTLLIGVAVISVAYAIAARAGEGGFIVLHIAAVGIVAGLAGFIVTGRMRKRRERPWPWAHLFVGACSGLIVILGLIGLGLVVVDAVRNIRHLPPLIETAWTTNPSSPGHP